MFCGGNNLNHLHRSAGESSGGSIGNWMARLHMLATFNDLVRTMAECFKMQKLQLKRFLLLGHREPGAGLRSQRVRPQERPFGSLFHMHDSEERCPSAPGTITNTLVYSLCELISSSE